MAMQMSPKSDSNHTQGWVMARLTSLYAHGSTQTADTARRSPQKGTAEDPKQVQDWAGECMTDCYNH